MNGITPIRGRAIVEFHTPTLYVAQWDGSKPASIRLVEELEATLEEMGASLLSAHRQIQMSHGEPELDLTIGRHDDDREWGIRVYTGEWIVLWRDMGRLADVERLGRDVGERRFRPVIILHGRREEIEGD
jgi:hypothetical protein